MIRNNFESICCLLVWSFSVVYSLYRFAQGADEIKHLLDPNDFQPGWYRSRERDSSDLEWSVFRDAFKRYYLLIVGHIVVSQIVWRFLPQLTLNVIIAYGSMVIGLTLHPLVVVIVWFNILLAFGIHLFGQRFLSHILFIFMLLFLHGGIFAQYKRTLFNQDVKKIFLFEVLIAWLNAKCLSFSMDRMELTRRRRQPYADDNLTMVLAYCLYFPALFTGPIYQYSSFLGNMVYRAPWNQRKFFFSSLQLCRYAHWALIYEILIHFLYSSAVQYHPELTDYLDSWTLCGLGYCLPCLFYLKYLVIYGSVGALAEMDGIQMPPPPKCVSRIHLSSNLWRHFDRGLHLWLTKYFYKPLVSGSDSILIKVFATFQCFLWVALWHGLDKAVITWSLLNFFEVTTEMVGLRIRRSPFIAHVEAGLSRETISRLKSALASPFFIIMIISNIFFLSNFDLGVIFVKRVLLSFPFPILPLLFIMYTACHVSLELME